MEIMGLMQITEKTKFGMSIAQWVAVFLFLIAIGGSIAGFGASLESAKEATRENKQRIDINEARLKQLESERAADNKQLLEMIYQIRESQIRIEGKLELKMDKYTK